MALLGAFSSVYLYLFYDALSNRPGNPTTFDLVVAAAGTPIRRYIDLERVLSNNRGSMVPITYLRPVPVQRALGGLVELDVYEPRLAVLTPETGEGSGWVK